MAEMRCASGFDQALFEVETGGIEVVVLDSALRSLAKIDGGLTSHG